MTQPRSADAFPAGALATRRTTGPALAPRDRRLAWQLAALVVIPATLALVLTGLWAAGAVRSAEGYGQAGRLAALGQQVTGLARAMAGERSSAATFISGGRPAAGLEALRRQYAITDARAARVRRLVSQPGAGYPAMKGEWGGGWGAGAAQVLASIAKLPGLRSQTVRGRAPALAVITGYSAATAGLFPVGDGIADAAGNATLITSVRALGSLSRMIDHASQQQAILGVALAGGRFGPGARTALAAARARQAGDLASFRDSATAEESWALAQTLARPPARQAQAVEQRATAAGNGALALGPQASQQWAAGMSYTVGWMEQAEQQLAGWITADAQALQQGATRSAIIRGGTGLGALVLVLLGTMFAARSMLRRRRLPAGAAAPAAASPAAAALETAGAPPAIGASAVPTGFFWRNHSLLERLLGLIDRLELHENDPQRLAGLFEVDHLATRIWRNSDSALVLAGHENPRPAGPLALVDVIRGAVSEIEEYGRVILDVHPGVGVSGSAATDTVHLLAELLENAATFSSETAQVVVSGHAVVGGGSLVTITDGGPGMSEEELALLNRQLASPAASDMTAAQPMGLFTVALLAARHGITVTLSTPPDGGTTAEVYLPAALISVDTGRGGWRRAGEPPVAWAGEEAWASAEAGAGEEASADEEAGAGAATGAGAAAGGGVAHLPFSALRFASRPQPPLGPETDEPEAVPLMLGAPVPAPAPEAATGMAGPGPVDAEPGGGPPIFESVRSGYLHAFGRDLLRVSEQRTGQPATGPPAQPPASWGEGGGRAPAGPPAPGHPASWGSGPAMAGPPASSGLPQRLPLPGQVRGTSVGQAAEPPEETGGIVTRPAR